MEDGYELSDAAKAILNMAKINDRLREDLRRAREIIDDAYDYMEHEAGCPAGYEDGKVCVCELQQVRESVDAFLRETADEGKGRLIPEAHFSPEVAEEHEFRERRRP